VTTVSTSGSTGPARSYELLGPKDDLLSVKGDDPRLVKERIQSLLSQWMRMENVTVLIGAGASKAQSGPLLPELELFCLKGMEKLCVNDPLKQFASVVQERKDKLDKRATKLTFEQWLSHLTNAAHVLTAPETPVSSLSLCGKSGIKPVDLQEFLRVLSQVVFMRCSIRLPSVRDAEVTGHHALVAKLIARDPSLGRSSIFTTNYDTLIEQALDDLSIHYADGFTGTIRRRFDPSCYGLDVYYPGDVAAGRVRRYDKFLHLYKLHGSVHWRRDGIDVIQVSDPRLGRWKEWDAKPTAEMQAELERQFPIDSGQLGILPTECKFAETLGMPYAHIFRALHQRLQEPQTFLLVLGYSFGDDHINRIIDDAMTNPSLVLLVVDPLPSAALRTRIDRYKKTGERAFLLNGVNLDPKKPEHGTFDDFAKNLLPNVQWLNDYIVLRKTEKVVHGASDSDGLAPVPVV